jgi:hypothetical protein
MADTMAVSRVERGSKQFQGAFSDLWLVTGTVSDQDAIADDVSIIISLTVPGVALGDMVVGVSFGKSQADANAHIINHAFVSAANTVQLVLANVDQVGDAYDADTLNGGGFKMMIGRPSW